MAQVPLYNLPQVRPDSSGEMSLSVSPNAFGANVGEALSGLGAKVEQAANTASDIQLRFKQIENSASVNSGFVDGMSKLGQIEANYNQLQGKAAVDAYPQYQKDLADLRQTVIDGAPNAAVKMQLDSEFSRRLGYSIVSGSHHAATEFKQYGVSQADAKVTLAINDAGAKYGDDKAFQTNLDAISTSVDQVGFAKGWAPEQIKAEKDKQFSNAYSTRVLQMSNNDPNGAAMLYNSVKEHIDAPGQLALEKVLESNLITKGSRDVADYITTGTGPAGGSPQAVAMSYFMGRGWSKEQSAGIVGTLTGESGSNLDPHAFRKNDAGLGLNSEGMGQWNRERLSALQAFAKTQPGGDWHSFQTQLAFVDHELRNSEAGTGAKLAKATTVEEAMRAAIGYERPAGWDSGNPTAGAGYGRRLAAAQRLLGTNVTPGAPGPDGKPSTDLVNNALSPTSTDADLASWIKRGDDLAEKISPGNASYKDAIESRITAKYNNVKQQANDQLAKAYVVAQGAAFGPNGTDGPQNFDAFIIQPGVKDAFNALPPDKQHTIQDTIASNAKADIAETPAVMSRYKELRGMYNTDPQAFANENIAADKNLTRPMKMEFIKLQDPDVKPLKIPKLAEALSVAKIPLEALGLGDGVKMGGKAGTPSAIKYNQFVGALSTALVEFANTNNRQPNDDEILKMTNGLLKQVVTGHSNGFFGMGGGDTTGPLFGQLPAGPSSITTVPDIVQAEIKAKFAAAGAAPPNEQTMREIYYHKIYQGIGK